MNCPLCQASLPNDATACTQCDWVRPKNKEKDAPYETRNMFALWLSLVPGLGHLYKGYILLGGVIFFIASPALLALAIFLAPGTLGLSLLTLPGFLLAVMFHAFNAKDRRAQVIERAQMMERAKAAAAH